MSSQLDFFKSAPAIQEPAYLAGLNDAQREAVLTPAHQALQVLAGAGTGKTELISRRFVKLAQELRQAGISRPQERILVVTFTNDAALGMRARIHQRLLENGEEGLDAQSWISTFHQFCMRLLRTHALEVGLPPDFSVLNSLEQQVLFNRMLHGIPAGDYPDIHAALERADLEHALPSDILSIESLQDSQLDDPEALLEPTRLYRLINRIKTAGLSPAEFLETALQQSRQLTERLKQLPVPHDRQLNAIENIQLKLDAWRQAFQPWAHADWHPVRDAEEKADHAGKKITAGLYKDELKILSGLYLMPRTFEPATPELEWLDACLLQEEESIRLVAAVYALYQETLLAQGACDFDDLINHSIALLARFPHLRARYQDRFEAVIVDEFQDSNGSQLRLLELLIRDGARNLTVVGDDKQSIYAFRFAQPENLDLIFRDASVKRIHLQTNYRSRPPVLSVANHLTGQLTRRPNQQLQACPENAAKKTPEVIWLDLNAADEADGKVFYPPVEYQKASEAEFIALEIARLVLEKKAAFSDIAILVKSHAKAEAIQQVLAGYHIPSIRQKNLGFFQEPVIKDAMALLRLMRNLGDDLSLIRILQSKLNQRQIRDLMRLRHALHDTGEATGLWETGLLLNGQPDLLPSLPGTVAEAIGDLCVQLWEIRKRKSRLTPVQLFLQLAETVGLIDPETPQWQQKQQRITIGMFERMLYLFSQNKPLQPTLDEVIETLEQYADDPNQELPVSEDLDGEDAVRIMTVFAAKGLEFPVVFAAYTEKARTTPADDTQLIFDPQYPGKAGFGLIAGKVNGMMNPKKELHQKCWQTPRSRLEAQRIFYVALTRAKERLYVIRCPQSFPWTAPDGYPQDAVRVLSEREGDFSPDAIDREALRAAIAALQEPQNS